MVWDAAEWKSMFGLIVPQLSNEQSQIDIAWSRPREGCSCRYSQAGIPVLIKSHYKVYSFWEQRLSTSPYECQVQYARRSSWYALYESIWGWLYDDQDVSLNTLCLLHFIQILYPLSHRFISKIMGEGRENNLETVLAGWIF